MEEDQALSTTINARRVEPTYPCGLRNQDIAGQLEHEDISSSNCFSNRIYYPNEILETNTLESDGAIIFSQNFEAHDQKHRLLA